MRHLPAALFAVSCLMTVPAWAASPFDGTYRGTTTPEWASRGCGNQQKSIEIEIAGGEGWTHHHKLTGEVDSSGHLSLSDAAGRSELTATIEGDQLHGTETVTASPKKLRGFYSGPDGETQCMRTVSAARQ